VSGTPEQTKSVVESGGINPLIALINHSSDVIKEHITWAIGNIAGDNIVYRDYFFRA